MDWFARDFDHPLYFRIYHEKEAEAAQEGPALAGLLDLSPGSRVLDLPCGWGRLQPALEARGLRVLGGDLSALNLQRHRQEFPGPLVRLDLRALPFHDGCADGVFCAYTSWGYFASDAENQAQLGEFARVLKPGGVLLLDLVGRNHLRKIAEPIENTWFRTRDGYRERVRWSPDQRRIWTDRIMEGERFRHDIWIPTGDEVLAFLEHAGFGLDQAFGGLDGCPWHADAARWIYRAIKI
ncbi:MAG: class I SAM-dependent methyltransferase [Holophaga sp.]|nr:class I SAM-dependent methyltransferase [Holophaga sp.]